MELFVDAYDWVMVPNVYGMALYADGGLITTKPYIAGANYIRKMSDFPEGPWCDTWNALFWTLSQQAPRCDRGQSAPCHPHPPARQALR